MMRIRTSLVTQRSVSATRYRRKRRISSATSRDGRAQLSAEKAYSVSIPIPQSGAASTIFRTTRAPAICPAVRGRPRALAQRPLPSMMIATWIPDCAGVCWGGRACACFTECGAGVTFSALPRGANQRLHVVQVPLECATSGGGELVLCLGHPPLERFRAGDVFRFLELARVHAQ